ncbi:protein ABHD16B-like [Rhineura floridana]|uniref:protein ABHD16B-like n=1 Tax=Rhineura floridana TaxID=261503 RepID=UPI002AC81A63|nr:protein ABHD16B-like [Rhineura floridana]
MCYKMKTYLMIKDSCLFKKWPVEYRWDEAGSSTILHSCSTSTITVNAHNSQGLPPVAQDAAAGSSSTSIFQAFKHCSSRFARYAIAHSIGRWLLYPGSVCLLNKVQPNLLVNGRTRLMEDFHGKRAKLIARDGNEIDTMFVDRRKRRTPEKKEMQLVICCEGNGSFYEVGCFFTPLRAGYSVLGWNHPGFGRSTGKPYPANDINAMEVVIQYAVHRLGFGLPYIAIYGYSLGSYTATWAAMTYPELGALVLDASFDSLLPLAMKVIKKSLRRLVIKTVTEHFNLNVAEMLCQYPGPVLLIRRILDEITSTQFTLESKIPIVKTNRANELLVQLLRCRYPDIMSEEEEETVRSWLAADCPQLDNLIYNYFYHVDDDWCLRTLESYKSSLGSSCSFPWNVGKNLTPIRRKQMALFLARKHLKNVETTHGRTLPPQEFQMPWKL